MAPRGWFWSDEVFWLGLSNEGFLDGIVACFRLKRSYAAGGRRPNFGFSPRSNEPMDDPDATPSIACLFRGNPLPTYTGDFRLPQAGAKTATIARRPRSR